MEARGMSTEARGMSAEARGMSTEARGTGSEERGTKGEAREAREGALEVRARHVARRPLDCKRNQRLPPRFSFPSFTLSPICPITQSPIRLCSQEWCEQRVVFSLARGKPPPTAAMRAGAERHAALEREVVETVEVAVETREDVWALRLLGAAARVLALGEGMREAMGGAMGRENGGAGLCGDAAAGITRESTPRLACGLGHHGQRKAETAGGLVCTGGCMWEGKRGRRERVACDGGGHQDSRATPTPTGSAEQERQVGLHAQGGEDRLTVFLTHVPPIPFLALCSSSAHPLLSHVSAHLLALLSSMVQHGLPQEPFFSSFRLQPRATLSPQVLEHAAEITCLADVTSAVSHAFQSLQPLHSTLLLRYEWQADGSLIHEDRFPYDPHWLQASISTSLDFWLGRRQPFIVPREEAWKCSWCSFAPVCRPDLRWKGQAGNGLFV
ncbi:unnamed protein product [Closterium sp. Naga37s-1]|nr:unnamed protein product [Closterium sp. Naga37s-1]